MNDLISIIVPVFNAEKYLVQCIDSLINQTYINLEILLIDDGSADNSGKICDEYAKLDNRIKVIHKNNGGVSSARNFGLDIEKGEYITFIDSDDFVAPNYCEELILNMTSDIDMVVLGLKKFSNEKCTLIPHRMKSGIYNWEQLSEFVIDDGSMSGFTLHSACAVLFKRQIIIDNKLLFHPDIRYNEDGLFCTQYFFCCQKNIYVDYKNAIYYYRTNPISATHTSNPLSSHYLDSMDKIQKILQSYNDSYQNIAIQLTRRLVSTTLSKVLYSVKQKDIKTVKKLIKNKDFQKALFYVNKKILSNKKLLLYWLMRIKNISLLSFCIGLNNLSRNS